jgi:hypothetical protein
VSNVEIEKKVIEPVIPYTEMPKKFTGVDSWLKFSNLKCHWCDQLPSSYPKFIPMNLERDKDGEDICDICGHFDEWNCAVAWVEKFFPKDQQWDALKGICLIESKFSGKRREKIMPSPVKTLMKAYSGKDGLTPKQYSDLIA